MKIVTYLRVSTDRQGKSGLGLEAQRTSIEAYAEARSACIVREFVEVESGKKNERPQLAAALHLAKVTGSTLVIAKLDRLSRNAAFLLALRDSGVKFIAADMPDANELTVGIMALVAEQERQAISQRTTDALKAAKAMGAKLGNPNGAAALRRAGKGNEAAVGTIKAKAEAYAADLKPIIQDIIKAGIVSLAGIANELNARQISTARDGKWHKATVANLLARIQD